MKKLILLAAVAALSACASHTHEIASAYVSPLKYQDYSCKQIRQEMTRITRKANQLAHHINKNADGDSAAMGVGLILFWPSLFFIDGDTPQAQEYAELRGRFDALEEASIQRNCSIKVESNPFTAIEKREQRRKSSSKSSGTEAISTNNDQRSPNRGLFACAVRIHSGMGMELTKQHRENSSLVPRPTKDSGSQTPAFL